MWKNVSHLLTDFMNLLLFFWLFLESFSGIWKNGLPIAQFEEYNFEDAVPDVDDKIYDRALKRMVPRKFAGGLKPSVVIKRVIYTDDEVKRKQAEDLEVKR